MKPKSLSSVPRNDETFSEKVKLRHGFLSCWEVQRARDEEDQGSEKEMEIREEDVSLQVTGGGLEKG